MSRPELLITALVYLAALVLGQRATAVLAPTAQEVGFAVAAIAGAVTAAMLYQRRARQPAPMSVTLAVGILMAALAVAGGMTTYVLWQSTFRPAISLPIAAVATIFVPLIVFPLLQRLRDPMQLGGHDASPVGELHVVLAAVLAIFVIAAAWFIPVPGRSSVRLVRKDYPSLTLGLPQWEAKQDSAMMEFGSIKLADPKNADRFIALRWMDADPVQPDEHVQTIAVGGLVVRDTSPAFVGRHQGTTFYLESDDHLSRAVATVWNCPQDHRALWILSYLSGPKNALLATHEKILNTVRCHSGRNKDVAATTQRVYPSFTPPLGFVKEDAKPGGGMRYVGEDDEEIAFDAGIPGRSDVVSENIPPNVISKLLTNAGIMQRIEGSPELTTVNDLQGHPRRVWSVIGIGPTRDAVQMEVMIWYCDKRNLTFIGRYATPGRHEPRVGINALLPAACHSE
ncbi:MAG: hypothetical protein QOE14_634 [Humisphaera sp.]|nr:hypothetical protein [Humisphaera sp.]